MKTVRAEVYFSGVVQGVGFRYHVWRTAGAFEVAGFTCNLNDGRVEVVAEGRRGELERFVDSIRDSCPGTIQHVSIEICQATGEFSGFSVRR